MENKFLKDNLIARWLDNRLNDDEKQALNTSGELDDLKVVLDDIDTWKVKKFDTEAGLKNLKERKKLVISPTLSQQKQQKSRNWLSIAASILILITGSYFSWNYFSNQATTIKTVIAESKTVNLPDGSKVKIDALSNISYNKKDWEHNRIIKLNGQAFFDVTKGSTFKVITKTGSIKVLGTQFNVNTSNNKFEVKCYEGKVAVSYKNNQKILTRGQSTIAKENRLYSTTHTTNTPTWISGYSKYTEVDLLAIIKDLEKYYKTKIELQKKYENLQFTGTLTHKDLNLALQTLFTSMEINYIVDKNNIVTIE
ncbi:FecR family protein [uncultured Polaribacter sp.]|uniref:FecR family protein n=1 Tax=uncultured Polaribacter sp. TaxID=174711 RepID=UPI00262BD302|nr:FecR family protein [uncultured Polaribacter sp.]